MTDLIYMAQPNCYQAAVKIADAGKDEKGDFVILPQTIFYPQGGGQPADNGVINIDGTEFTVIDVRLKDGIVYHYLTASAVDLIGKNAVAKVDSTKRKLNSRYHTAGHLISAVVEELYPQLKATKGHQFPNEAYIEFMGTAEINQDKIVEAINTMINNNVKVVTTDISREQHQRVFDSLPYAIPTNKKSRACKIGGYEPVPCGGTHVTALSEIGTVSINKIKSKKGKIKISYELI